MNAARAPGLLPTRAVRCAHARPACRRTADRRPPALPADRVPAAGSMRRCGAARECLRRARPAARSTASPWTASRSPRSAASGGTAALPRAGHSGGRRPAAAAGRERPLYRGHDRGGAAAGCDTVVPVEQLRVADGYAELGRRARPAPWAHVHRRASDRTQGALLLERRHRAGRPEIAVAASAGMARVRVSSQPAIIVISTGNELVEPGDPIEPHQIRRSNAYARRRGPAPARLPAHRRRSSASTRQRCCASGCGCIWTRTRCCCSRAASPWAASIWCRRCSKQLGVRRVSSRASPSARADRCGLGPRARAALCLRCRAIRSRRWCACCAMSCRRCTPRWECAAPESSESPSRAAYHGPSR